MAEHPAPANDPRAACRGADIELFVSPDDTDEEPYPSAEAMSFCNRCAIRPECLDWALSNGEIGVWGGTSTYQREQLLRERRQKRLRCPGCSSLSVTSTVHPVTGGTETCLSCGLSWYVN